jgi:hypothetical protein
MAEGGAADPNDIELSIAECARLIRAIERLPENGIAYFGHLMILASPGTATI